MMIDPIDFFVLGLATWRAASLLVSEKGPFHVFEKLRTLAGIVEMRLDDRPEVYKATPDTFLAQLLDCVWCCSVWVGIFITLLYFFFPGVMIWVCLPMALSAAAIWFESMIRLERN